MKHFFSATSLLAILLLGICNNAESPENKKETLPLVKEYPTKEFDFSSISFLTPKQCEQHYTLYKGYVSKLHEIRKKIINAQRSPGITYSEYRGLKLAETFALNGALLHELYFENIIDGAQTQIEGPFKKLVIKNFGSVDNYLKDLRDAASCARGWAITGYCLWDGSLANFVLEAHNETVPVLVIPLVVVDVYEHAYMIDFGIDRATYLNGLIKAINWDVVEERLANVLP